MASTGSCVSCSGMAGWQGGVSQCTVKAVQVGEPEVHGPHRNSVRSCRRAGAPILGMGQKMMQAAAIKWMLFWTYLPLRTLWARRHSIQAVSREIFSSVQSSFGWALLIPDPHIKLTFLLLAWCWHLHIPFHGYQVIAHSLHISPCAAI